MGVLLLLNIRLPVKGFNKSRFVKIEFLKQRSAF